MTVPRMEKYYLHPASLSLLAYIFPISPIPGLSVQGNEKIDHFCPTNQTNNEAFHACQLLFSWIPLLILISGLFTLPSSIKRSELTLFEEMDFLKV